MRIFIILILLFSVYFQLSIYDVQAAAVTAEELVKSPQQYDGKEIVYKGEVIGDVMVRKDFAWINVSDESGVMGIICPKELVEKIKYKGSYAFKGDIISVKGTFRRWCPEHGGDTDIHAEKISIVQEGEAVEHPLDAEKIKMSIILSAIAFALAIIHLITGRFR
ncbi:MAG: DNA-binding protein [Candidatus Omnitrophota bacterium]|nr:MAG: DNA-binding protein [Candidatus Omnitrophota bacterium]